MGGDGFCSGNAHQSAPRTLTLICKRSLENQLVRSLHRSRSEDVEEQKEG